MGSLQVEHLEVSIYNEKLEDKIVKLEKDHKVLERTI
jgi:hypothetical protein